MRNQCQPCGMLEFIGFIVILRRIETDVFLYRGKIYPYDGKIPQYGIGIGDIICHSAIVSSACKYKIY